MDPITILVIVFILFEAGSGGFLTANVVGGATGAGSAVWRETKSGARARYKKRAKRLKKTRRGRVLLRTEAAIAGVARGVTRGVVAAVKGVPGGAAIGRELAAENRQRTRQAIRGAKSRGAKAAKKWRERHDATSDEPEQVADVVPVTEAPPWPDPAVPVAHCQYCGNAIVDGACSHCGQDPTKPFVGTSADPCRCCGGDHGRQMTGGEHCDGCDRHGMFARFPETYDEMLRREDREQLEQQEAAAQDRDNPHTSPAPSGSEKEDHVTTNTSDVAEDKGSIPYVEAWDGETGGAELLVSQVSEIGARIAQAVDANARHEVGGGQDVAGKWQAAVEAIQAAGEATDAHAKALHQAWDATNERLKGHAAASAQDLAGAH